MSSPSADQAPGSGGLGGNSGIRTKASDQPTLNLCRRKPAAEGRDQGRFAAVRVGDVFDAQDDADAKTPRGEGRHAGSRDRLEGSVGRPARDRGGLGGLFRILNRRSSDQPTPLN